MDASRERAKEPLLTGLGPVMPFYRFFFGEGSPTKIDYGKKVGTLILASLLEDLGGLQVSGIQKYECEKQCKARPSLVPGNLRRR